MILTEPKKKFKGKGGSMQNKLASMSGSHEKHYGTQWSDSHVNETISMHLIANITHLLREGDWYDTSKNGILREGD